MDMSKKVKTNRAFIKKAFYFIKTYPLTSKDPQFMIQQSIYNLVKLVEAVRTIKKLEPLSSTAEKMIDHSHPEDLFEFPIEGDDHRFIIYRPCKFLDPNYTEIVDIYDLLYIP